MNSYGFINVGNYIIKGFICTYDNSLMIYDINDKPVMFAKIPIEDILYYNELYETITLNYCKYEGSSKSRSFRTLEFKYDDIINSVDKKFVDSDEWNIIETIGETFEDFKLMSEDKWSNAIKETKHITMDKNILFVINSNAGDGQAMFIFNTYIQPILNSCNVKYTYTDDITNSFESKLETSKLDNYHIVGIGGDGTIHCIFNTLYKLDRLDIAVSCIPAGSGNALAKCITETYNEDMTPVNCLFRILKGTVKPIDLTLCKQAEISHVSFLSQSWGFVSDIDIESDWMRFTGSIRFSVATLYKLMSFDTYNATLSYTTIKNVTHTIDDDFVTIWAFQLPWVATDMNICKTSKFNDKCIYLMIIKKGITRYELLQMFINMNTTDIFFENEYFTVVQVIRYELTPKSDDTYLVIDGESVNNSTTSVELLNKTGNILC